jgi:predicted TPR repeat methyltransferase
MSKNSQVQGFDQALALHQQGRLPEAEQGYRRILRKAPTHFDALHLLGVICGQTDRFDEALELLKRALAQRPKSAPALNNLGNTLGSLGRHEEAVQAFERALAERPDDAKALRNRGTSLRALERPIEALASFDAAIALKSDYPEALIGRAEALLTLHRKGQAIETFRQALPLGKDVDQIRYALASLGADAPPPVAPAGYVEALFDMYSHTFDKHLVERLGYRTPELLFAELSQASPPTACDIVDLGCGTGLCGPRLRPLARQLVGVDLSSQMLAKARELGHYDELVHSDIVGLLRQRPQQFDIAVAADVFVYIGDLSEVFAATHAALRPGGLFAFSVEACESVDFLLGPTRRYAHSLGYLQRLAAAHGLSVESARESAIRKESDEAVRGYLVVMRRD